MEIFHFSCNNIPRVGIFEVNNLFNIMARLFELISLANISNAFPRNLKISEIFQSFRINNSRF